MNTKNKKSTPSGAPIPQQDYGTTPEEKTQAEKLFDMIRDDRPLKRPKNPNVDRALRKMIEHANNHGDCVINNGTGYYRPDPRNEIDEYAFHLYKSKELAKAKAIISKIEAMDNAFYRRYHE